MSDGVAVIRIVCIEPRLRRDRSREQATNPTKCSRAIRGIESEEARMVTYGNERIAWRSIISEQ
jgi:hypothetical protein